MGSTRVLTTANALDIWRPAGATNRTNPAVLRSLVDSKTSRDSIQSMQTMNLKLDGPLFDPFGAGDIKMAVGGEYIHYLWNERPTQVGTGGPASTSSQHQQFNYNRSIYAAYAEFVIPVVSPDMEIPLVRDLKFDFAGRYDQYNDFGSTKNPKISFEWGIIDGIRTSAAMGSSFTAPPLSAIGVGSSGVSSATGVGNGGAQNNLIVQFNDTRPFNGGAGIAGTFVSNAVACFAAGSTPVDAAGANAVAVGGLFPTATGCKNNNGTGQSQGLTVSGSNANLKPQIGLTYSVNLIVDFGKLVDWLEGLDAQLTYYQARINGLITNVNIQTSQTNAGLPYLTVFGPANGCGTTVTPATACTGAFQPGWAPSDPVIQSLLVGRPLDNPLPQRVYSLGSSQVQNALNLWQNGLDFALNYRVSTENYGDFTFGLNGNQILRFTQQNAGGTAPFDIKNGKNGGRFVGQEFAGSISIGWRMDPFNVNVRFNHQSAWNDAMTQFPYNLPGPNRLANTYHIPAFDTVSLGTSYNLPDEWLSGSQISLNIQDLFNTYGTVQNSTGGLATGSAIGRQFTLSFRKKW
jgi:iron complex outermembrane receptor protein